MARVLVTGGAGFIGSHLVERLLARGDSVVIVDDLSSGSRTNLAQASQAKLLVADLARLPELESELQGVDVIFHLAALISGQDSLREPAQYIETNLTGTARVIDLAGKLKARRIVFASSSTVYGKSGGSIKREDTPAEPMTVYALTKLAGEHLLAMYAPIHNYSYVALRLFNVYGPRQGPNHPYANVTCKFAHAAANSLPIDVYGDGEQSRDFVYVDDVVNAFMAVRERSEQPIYNVGSSSSCSINELIGVVERVGKVNLERRQRPPWPNDVRSVRADTTRFDREHTCAPRTKLEAGIERTIEFFKAAR